MDYMFLKERCSGAQARRTSQALPFPSNPSFSAPISNKDADEGLMRLASQDRSEFSKF
ncbi:hypothetical protein BT69DRAFT_288059 [Atractiella rhizophila]|nr:hypothetical protein BT69DRAFT_288059 [Atractiella rhizophila]